MLMEVISILDMSGSMSGLTNDTIGSYNTYLQKLRMQKKHEIYLTLVVFNTESKIIYEHVNVKKIKNITTQIYNPEGGTALNDAIGIAITRTQQFIHKLKRKYVPKKVSFFIITDGEENSSRDYTNKDIKKMVTKSQKKDKWEYVFVGSNIDAVTAGEERGFKKERIANINNGGKGQYAAYGMAHDILMGDGKVDAQKLYNEAEKKIN
ncbi:von_Willebrand factor type A domain-containing protein [Hexamita inflata]|uniref:von Willebrand factor type A domain-containing protein n=1 Tax=Hexamita inflata TaxID=28002 RepID=A0AA86VN33_9EUKA|nr:von Willebrand factor type A domain-containing protein [Hexamita inflata]